MKLKVCLVKFKTIYHVFLFLFLFFIIFPFRKIQIIYCYKRNNKKIIILYLYINGKKFHP